MDGIDELSKAIYEDYLWGQYDFPAARRMLGTGTNPGVI